MGQGANKPARRKPTDERRMEIVDAAMRVLAQRGARACTAQGIADSVGLTAGAIYRHFGSMREIAEGVLDELDDVLLPPPWATDADPETCLALYFRSRSQLFIEQPPVALLLFSDQLTHLGGPELRERLAALRAREHDHLSGCLRKLRSGRRSTKREEAQAFIVLATLAELGRQTATHLDGGDEPSVSPTDLWAALKEVLQIGTPKRRRK